MSLAVEEKSLIQESLQLYLQAASRQMSPEQMEQLSTMAQNIMTKLETLGNSSEPGGNKPAGISDEWYDKVCTGCEMLTASGCTDKVTAKFPGKCDPILKHERAKMMAQHK